MDVLGFTGEQFNRLVLIMNDPVLRKLFISYCGMALLGQFAYAGILWYRKEIDCVWHRFQSDPRSSIAALGTNLIALLVVALAPDMIVPAMTLQTVLFNGFMQGIALDSALNKSTRPIWTTEQRLAVSNAKADK
jgi:hypothetical protein